MGNNAPCKVVGVGTVKIRMFDRAIRVLGNVRHVPEMRQNLISLGYHLWVHVQGWEWNSESL